MKIYFVMVSKTMTATIDEFLIFIKNNLTKKSLKNRMQALVKKYNGNTFESYKPYIITIKSKEILEYVNFTKNSIKDKIINWNVYNKILLNVSNDCYNRFSPNMIYSFNDEIHMVFYNMNDYPELYNGNINKMLTTVSSFVTRQFTKEFVSKNIDFEFTLNAKYVQFDTEYETLNYLIWRQNDCKRNNIITLYKYYNNNVSYMSLLDITQKLDDNMSSEEKILYEYDLNNIIYGIVLKKELFNVDSENKCMNRTVMSVDNVIFANDFKSKLKKYVYEPVIKHLV